VAETTAPETPADAATGDGAVDDIDVCALIPREDVEAVVGAPVGAAAREDLPPFFFGCRYEEDGITSTISLGTLVHENEDNAESSFDIGAENYEAVEGIGDRAYNAQPIQDITVLYGNYEVSVGIYF